MCIRADVNGCAGDAGTHVSVYVYLMRGHDSALKCRLRVLNRTRIQNGFLVNQGCSITLIVPESHHCICGRRKPSPFAENCVAFCEQATPTKNGIHYLGHTMRKRTHRILDKLLGLQVTRRRIFNELRGFRQKTSYPQERWREIPKFLEQS